MISYIEGILQKLDMSTEHVFEMSMFENLVRFQLHTAVQSLMNCSVFTHSRYAIKCHSVLPVSQFIDVQHSRAALMFIRPTLSQTSKGCVAAVAFSNECCRYFI